MWLIKIIKNKIFLSVLMVVATLFYVRTRFLVVELSDQNQEMRILKLDLEDQKKKYLLELSLIQNPKEVQKQSQEKFNLGFNKENSRFIYVEEE